MDILFMTVLKLFYFVYLFCLTFVASNDLGLCANPYCSEPIGLGVTVQGYNANEPGKLSFLPRQDVEIFVKEYGEKKNLFGVLLNGKRGFVPQNLVQEKSTKVQKDALVPAIIRYGLEENGLSDFANKEDHASNQDVHNQISTSLQSHQAFEDNSIVPTETSVPNLNSFTGDASSQVQFPSSGSSFDPQLGNHAHQHSSLHLSHSHQSSMDTSILTDFPQHSAIPSDIYSAQSLIPSSSSLAGSYHQSGLPGDNTAYQQYGSDASNQGYQQYGSDASNTGFQHSGTDFSNTAHPNVVPGSSNTDNQYVEPVMGNSAYQNVVPGVVNSAYPNVGPDASITAHHHVVLGVGDANHQFYMSNYAQAAQNLAGTVFSSQNNFVPNTLNHPNVNIEQVMSQSYYKNSMQFGASNHQNDPLNSGHFPNQQQVDAIQSSFPSQSLGYPPALPFASDSFSGDSNSQGWKASDSVSNYQQADSPFLNAEAEIKKSHNFIPSSVENSNDRDSFEETMKILEKHGYGSEELYQDYDLNASSDVNPSLDLIIGASRADPLVNSQTDTLKGSHSENLQSSFKSTTTELKSDQPSDKISNTVNQQTSNSLDVPPLEENQVEGFEEDDDGETDIEDETDTEDEINESDTETVENDNMNRQAKNMIEKHEQLKKIENNEALSHNINRHGHNSELSDVQNSHANQSNEDFKIETEVGGNPAFPEVLSPQSEHGIVKTSLPHSNIDGHNSIGENITDERKKEIQTAGNPESNTRASDNIEVQENLAVHTEANETKSKELNPQNVDGSSVPQADMALKYKTNMTTDVTGEEKVKTVDVLLDSSKELNDGGVTDTNITENEVSVVDEILKKVGSSKDEERDQLNPYQIRNLKEDQESENVEPVDEMGENVTYPEDDEYSIVNNSLEAIRLFITELMTWVPEPLYSTLMDLESKGLSPRVPVFTALCAVPCILLIIVVLYIKETSKEKCLIVKLAHIEKNVFTLSAEKNALEEKLEKTFAEFESTKNMLDEERKGFDLKKTEITSLKQLIEKANLELECNLEEINILKEREKQYMELIKDHEKIHLDLVEEKSLVEKKLADDEDELNELSDQLKEKESQITMLQTEVQKFKQSNEDCEEKLSQLQKNCNQLLKEAEVWNLRVNELNSKLSEETSTKEELQNSLDLKDAEIKSLTHLVETFKAFEEMESTNEDENKSNEEQLKRLMDCSSVLLKLQKQEDENKLLSDKLVAEKNKILEMEVELLESKSEVDKLKLNYNQALQDKAEATTKLEVLTNYFKDKELLLQKQLGVQEAFRERREKDADSAERQIVLIEQENTSYKYQVASMKQEMEETERNLKSQIAAQEKKAHENWIAARAAERKLEDMKQETTQLRQRLTLLEREQENWVNSPRDDLIRPIPKRISGLNDDPINGQDLNNSIDPRHMFHPPPPMMLPPDRPLPPLLPPLPPFLAPMEPPPFRPPPPWHHQDPSFRMTPPDFMGPPRNRHSTVIDGDPGPLQSSPLGGNDMRESPSHSLPDFHDIPPPPRPPFFPPPPGHHPRYPMPPQYGRRDYIPDKKRTDAQSDTSSVGHASQPPPLSQDNWSHNTRV